MIMTEIIECRDCDEQLVFVKKDENLNIKVSVTIDYDLIGKTK